MSLNDTADPRANAGSAGDDHLDQPVDGAVKPVQQTQSGGYFYRWRNRLMASGKFRRFAALFPLTRPIVRHQARSLFDLVAGFTYSQTVFALVEGGVIAALEESAQPLSYLAARLAMSEDHAERLLMAGVSIGILTVKSGKWFGLTLQGAALAGDPGIIAMVRHHRLLYQDLADPLALFRADHPDTKLARYYGYAANSEADALTPAEVSHYSELMALSQRMVSAEIVSSLRFKGINHLWDIGGGAGVFARTALAHNPGLKITLLDLPAVADASRDLPENKEQADRLTFEGGDFLKSAMPDSCDAVTLVRVLFDHDDTINQKLLAHIYDQMKPGMRLYIAEPMAETRGAHPVGHAYYGLYLKAMGMGRCRTFATHAANLRTAGFSSVREISTPQPIITRLIEAQK